LGKTREDSIKNVKEKISSFEQTIEKFQFSVTHTEQLEKNIEDLKEKFLVKMKGSKIPQGTQHELTESLK